MKLHRSGYGLLALAVFIGLSKYFVQILDSFVDLLWPPPPLDTNPFLLGKFAPVDELAPVACQLSQGTLPKNLEGVLLRNGPNPMFAPKGRYHWFDGHAMVHSVQFLDGTAIYSSRYLQTPRHKADVKAGGQVFMNLGDLVGPRGMAKMLLEQLKAVVGLVPKVDKLENTNVNTAFAYHSGTGKIYATAESNLPFEIALTPDGDVSSMGYDHFNGTISHPVTAHPKYDPSTKEMFTFAYHLDEAHHISYSVVGPDGMAKNTVKIELPQPVMIHDWAITETRFVVMDLPLVFDGKNMIVADDGWVFQFNSSRRARIGVGPRVLTSADEIVWIDMDDTFFSFHTMSARDEGDTVVLTGCRMPSFRMDFDHKTVNDHTHLWQWRINVLERKVVSHRLLERPLEFPTVNNDRLTVARYGYAALWGSSNSVGLQKIDLLKGEPLGSVMFGEDWEGGEFVFASSTDGNQEDDGYLIGIVSGMVDGHFESKVLVYDARTMASTPVAAIILPRRVPHGFHAQWIPAHVLKTHRKAHDR